MKLYEYQAKELFRGAGLPTPKSALAADESQIEEAVNSIGAPCMVKAQVLHGGRGKAGLVKKADSVADAVRLAGKIMQKSGAAILVEEAVAFRSELYLSLTPDAGSGGILIMASSAGGVEIETLAEEAPEKIIREIVPINRGLMPYQARDLAYRIAPEAYKPLSGLLMGLYQLFRARDAELAEINPLFITAHGNLVCGDGKFVIDDASGFRQPAYLPGREHYESEAAFEAAQEGIPYLQFDGDISLMCAGAGLTTTVYDLVNYEGGRVANYLEFGGPNYRKAKEAMRLCLKNEAKVILVVTFGTIARADVMAEGIVAAIEELKPDRPIVTCIRGTNEEEADRILKEAGLTPLYDTEEAVRTAVRLAGEKEGAAR